MLSHIAGSADCLPISISMEEGRKTFSHCILVMRVIRGRKVPERMLGMKPSPFVSCYWSSVCDYHNGEYPPAFNQESDELEKKGVLFHTESVSKDVDPEWNSIHSLFITSSCIENNEKIRFLVRHTSLKVLAEGNVSLSSVLSLIHDQYNIQSMREMDSTQGLIVSVPLTSIKEGVQTSIVVEFSLRTIPNQALYFAKKHILLHGFQHSTLQNFIRIALVFRNIDALHTILTLANTFNPKDEQIENETLLSYLGSHSNLFRSLEHMTHFTSDLCRDIKSKNHRNIVIYEIVKWIGDNSTDFKSIINRDISGKTLLGFSITLGNVELTEYLLNHDANLLQSHSYEGREYFVDELASMQSKEMEEIVYHFWNRLSIDFISELRISRDTRQRRYDIIRGCLFIHKADSFIDELASKTIHLERSILSLLIFINSSIQKIKRNEDDNITDIIEEVESTWKEIEEKSIFEELILYEYCNFSLLKDIVDELSKNIFNTDGDDDFTNIIPDQLLNIMFTILFYCNKDALDIVVTPIKNNLQEFLSFCDSHKNIQDICYLSASVSFVFTQLPSRQYKFCIGYVINKITEYFDDIQLSEVDISPNSKTISILSLCDSLTRSPRGIIILKIIEHASFLNYMHKTLTTYPSLIQEEDEHQIQFLNLILSILANFARDVSLANFLVSKQFIKPVFNIVNQFQNNSDIYYIGMMLLNRLFVESKEIQNHLRNGWDKLDPVVIQGGTPFLAIHKTEVIQLMWHGLNHYCYSNPKTCIASCFMVWRLLYYNCIPEHEVSAFIDSFGSKFRRLWESTDDIDVKIGILQVLRQILAIRKISTTNNLVHIAIEHDFLSYAYKCIKQYYDANKPRIIQASFEFLAGLSVHEQIAIQLTQDPDWIVAEDSMNCLSHPDYRNNPSVQHSVLWLLGRLIDTNQNMKVFTELLCSLGLIQHIFQNIFPKYANSSYQTACNTAASALLVMVPYASVRITLFRMDGLEKLVTIAKKILETNETLLLNILLVIRACCNVSSYAKEVSIMLKVPQLVSVACMKFSKLQARSEIRELINTLLPDTK